jgi:hypothetical protein
MAASHDERAPGSSPVPPSPVLPSPLSPEEAAADRRSLKVLVIWLGGCAFVGALYLLFAIWLDWV